jgi:hypothetical protein
MDLGVLRNDKKLRALRMTAAQTNISLVCAAKAGVIAIKTGQK